MKRHPFTLDGVVGILVALSFAIPVFAAPLEGYISLEAAATAALDDAEALTQKFEAGGAIYQCGSAFAYLAPHTDGKRNHVSITVLSPGPCVLAGFYHTHPKGNDHFSAEDVNTLCEFQTVGFIKPQGGSIRMLNCRDMSSGARDFLVRASERWHGVAL